jgi:hypothetical protein
MLIRGTRFRRRLLHDGSLIPDSNHFDAACRAGERGRGARARGSPAKACGSGS